jgi:pectin methylesterase-like acyl-CoA thioesterase
VNPGGTAGCFSSINAAIAAASPNDTVKVAVGTYKEDVVIGKALSLIGAGSGTTAIDAAGLANGVYIDGIDNPGLAIVVVGGVSSAKCQIRRNPGRRRLQNHHRG